MRTVVWKAGAWQATLVAAPFAGGTRLVRDPPVMVLLFLLFCEAMRLSPITWIANP